MLETEVKKKKRGRKGLSSLGSILVDVSEGEEVLIMCFTEWETDSSESLSVPWGPLCFSVPFAFWFPSFCLRPSSHSSSFLTKDFIIFT